MKFTGFLDSIGQTRQKDRRPSRRGPALLAVAATALFMGLSLRTQAAPVLVTTPVYLYTSTGYEDVSSEILTVDGHTYVMTDTPFEIFINFSLGHVYDIDAVIIGFVPQGVDP